MSFLNFLLKGLSKLRRILRYPVLKLQSKNKKYTHLYIGSPYYGNLGDQQIRSSSLKFLKDNGIKYLELSIKDFYFYKNIDFKHIKVVCLQGGGNFGDVYPLDQNVKNEAVKRFFNKRIIVFPQTLYCNDYNSEIFKQIQLVFGEHKNAVLTAREEVSFDLFKKYFPLNKIIFAPDIVLSENKTSSRKRKNQILFLMRRDIEKTIDGSIVNELEKCLQKNNKIVREDTNVDYVVNEINRSFELKKIFKKIRSSRLVITDRLHGMIFSAITSTPCIVFSNYNHKISSCYELLKNLRYIKYIDDISVKNVVKSIDELSNIDARWEKPDKSFEFLREELLFTEEK